MSLDNFSEEYLNTLLNDGLTIREHIEKGLKNAKKKELESSNPKFHRTFEERELSFEFSQKYSKKIKTMENKIYLSKDNTIKYNENSKISIIKAILICNRCIYNYNKLKKFCYKNNGQLYFQDMWEYCHNSSCECFEYITSTKDFRQQLMNLLKNKKG